jgi:hypothetical protein
MEKAFIRQNNGANIGRNNGSTIRRRRKGRHSEAAFGGRSTDLGIRAMNWGFRQRRSTVWQKEFFENAAAPFQQRGWTNWTNRQPGED